MSDELLGLADIAVWNRSKQYPDDKPLVLALCKEYEGETPTAPQKNPHPPDTSPFATWVIATASLAL